MVFHAREEGEQVLLKLEADEFLRTHEAVCLRSFRLRVVPGVVDHLSEEVDPAPVSG